MNQLYLKAQKYSRLTDQYWKLYKELQKEFNITSKILPEDFPKPLKKLYDMIPDFEEHFEEDIYEAHGLFQAKVGDVEIHILYGHEEIKVITPKETFTETTR